MLEVLKHCCIKSVCPRACSEILHLVQGLASSETSSTSANLEMGNISPPRFRTASTHPASSEADGSRAFLEALLDRRNVFQARAHNTLRHVHCARQVLQQLQRRCVLILLEVSIQRGSRTHDHKQYGFSNDLFSETSLARAPGVDLTSTCPEAR